MLPALRSSDDPEKSRRLHETENARKKQKLEPVTFSDPTSLVTFIIGKKDKSAEFKVHKEFACTHSEVLNAAFNSSFIEGQTQTHRLEDTREEVFRLLMQWLYSQKLVLLVLERCSKDSDSLKAGFVTETVALTKLWVLAEKLEMPGLQNVALKGIDDLSRKLRLLHTGIFHWIYENTAPGSLLRRFTTANLASLDVDRFHETTKDFPLELLIDFSVYMLKREKGLEKKTLDVSDHFVKED